MSKNVDLYNKLMHLGTLLDGNDDKEVALYNVLYSIYLALERGDDE